MKSKIGVLCRKCHEVLTDAKCTCGNCGVGEKNGNTIMFIKEFFLADIVKVVVDEDNAPVWYKSFQITSDNVIPISDDRYLRAVNIIKGGNGESKRSSDS